ncbi:MAG: hypothetical protein ABFE07_06565 [Armatimonadia bacterium]
MESYWLDEAIYYKFCGSDRFGEITNAARNVVGIPWPGCERPMLYDRLRASVDVWGVGYDTFLVCPHMEAWGDEPCPEDPCNTLVFVEEAPPAYEMAARRAMAEALRAGIQQDERQLSGIEADLEIGDLAPDGALALGRCPGCSDVKCGCGTDGGALNRTPVLREQLLT